jgi:uncharacterized protein (DUF362 family)
LSEVCWLYQCQQYNADYIADLLEKNIEVKSGEKIFIKPNWVIHPFKGKEERWVATITNVAMIEAVLKVLHKKLGGQGQIVIGDSPMGRCDINKLWALTNIETVANEYRSRDFKIEILDLRNYYLKTVAEMVVHRIDLAGDPRGSNTVELGSDSIFHEKERKIYGFVDGVFQVSDFHNENHNRYVISQSVLDCDYFINLPKMKTHRSAGLTCAMKNLVGITTNKNSVPHYTDGCVAEGGDSFPEVSDGHTVFRIIRMVVWPKAVIPFRKYLMDTSKMMVPVPH